MQYPQININGTNGQTLLDEYKRAAEAVSAAITAMQAVTVHGRDYQTVRDDDVPNPFLQAQFEHGKRLRMLIQIENDMHDIAVNLDGQLWVRKERELKKPTRLDGPGSGRSAEDL